MALPPLPTISAPASLAPPPPRLTPFSVPGYLNAKHVTSTFAKQDSQTFHSNRKKEGDWERDEAAKRRRLLGEDGVGEEQLKAAAEEEGGRAAFSREGGNVLLSGKSEKAVPRQAVLEAEADTTDKAEATVDPLTKTIVIHPGSRWLRIGLASSAYPLEVPNIIARRVRSSSSTNSQPQETVFLRPLPAPPAPPKPETASNMDADMLGSDSDSEKDAVPVELLDPLSMKIASIRGDYKARMRAFKLRGQGNGQKIANDYNDSQAGGEKMGDLFNDAEEIEWTATSGPDSKDVYVGHKALRIANPAAEGYSLRYPIDRGTFNTSPYTSSQELLGDICTIWLTTLQEELSISPSELKDYSCILLIPDLYSHLYVRELTNLILRTIGFRQLWVQQEAVAATFGAGISTGCVVDIGAKKTSISCVEEGLVLPESRIELDFAGDDITQFLETLLRRQSFPYRELDLGRWYDLKVMDELKERVVVLGEKDVGMNLYEFLVRKPGKGRQAGTWKFSMRVYDDSILAPYALFAPRIVDFEGKKKRDDGSALWRKEGVDDLIEIGGDPEPTLAMRNSTSHLLPQRPAASLATLPSLPPIPGPEGLSAFPSPAGTPQPFASTVTASAGGLATPMLESRDPLASSVAGSPKNASVAAQPAIDVRAESSKLPLDVAVVESILACGAEERMRKVSANIIIVGGTANIHNIGFALHSRVGPQLAHRAPSLAGQLQVVPSPQEIDPKILAWKGIATLSRLEVAEDLWVTREDWERFGVRALRERAFYFA